MVRMLNVSILRGATVVGASQDSLEMDTTVQVSTYFTIHQLYLILLATADIDECLNVTCGQNAMCDNTVGSYSCQCDPGFVGDGYKCTSM